MISKNLNKMYYNRIKISRPIEKDFYFGNKLNRNQSILINNVYYNIDRLIKKNPDILWNYLHADNNKCHKRRKFILDSIVYSQLKSIILKSFPELIKNLEDERKLKLTKKELCKQINESQIGLSGARFTSLGIRNI